MARVAANFGTVFPIAGRPAVLPPVGGKIGLSRNILSLIPVPFPVYVSERWAAGWTFGTRFPHPDYPGGSIEFSFSKSLKRHVRLRIHANVPDFAPAAALCGVISVWCWLYRKRIYRGIADDLWTSFANNLRSQGW